MTDPGLFGAPDGNSMDDHPEHAVVVVWLLVLGITSWPMLVTVLRGFRTGLLALPEERSTLRTGKAVLADLHRTGLAEPYGDGWRLTDFGLEWCEAWSVPGSRFAMRLAAAREFTSR